MHIEILKYFRKNRRTHFNSSPKKGKNVTNRQANYPIEERKSHTQIMLEEHWEEIVGESEEVEREQGSSFQDIEEAPVIERTSF